MCSSRAMAIAAIANRRKPRLCILCAPSTPIAVKRLQIAI
jgi:hypothetical protein